jgi:hypothetical protein
MKKFLFTRVLLFFMFIMICMELKAQISAVSYTIANDLQPGCNTKQLEFDLLLLDLDASQPFEVQTVQAGILVNPAIYNGGTVTASIIAGTSSLNSFQQPTSITFTQSTNCIKIASKSPPGCGGGSIISANPANPTRICRVRLTNTQNFAAVPANLTFCFTTAPYPAKLSYYPPGCVGTTVACAASNCFSVACNLPLNTIPAAYAVTGSGFYCSGGVGLPVGLSNSQKCITYTLFKNNVAQVPAVAGTGSAISFGNQPAGTYTVQGIGPCGSATMIGNAVITENPLLQVSVSIVPDANPVCSNDSVTFTATPVNGGTTPAYQWKVNGINVGTSSNIYSFIPLNNDVVTVVLTSNTSCPSGNPATSMPVNMIVSSPPATRSLDNFIVSSGQDICFDATVNIEVSDFLIETGGSVNLIAGAKIKMLPGTRVEPGGYLHGFISANCLWCGIYSGNNPVAVQADETGKEAQADPFPDKSVNKRFSVHPNPTEGNFVLELQDVAATSAVKVEIYGICGELVWRELITGVRKQEFSLAAQPAGLYVIHILTDTGGESLKIIKQ